MDRVIDIEKLNDLDLPKKEVEKFVLRRKCFHSEIKEFKQLVKFLKEWNDVCKCIMAL